MSRSQPWMGVVLTALCLTLAAAGATAFVSGDLDVRGHAGNETGG